MTAAGVVTRVAADGSVEVELAAPAGCRACAGVCTWRQLPGTRRATFATDLRLAAGEPVVVALPERYVLLAALLVHGLPLAALLAGALAGYAVTGTDSGAGLGAVAGVALAVLGTPRLRRRVEDGTLRRLTLSRGTDRDGATHSL
jgi:positive regulator of sigma E activity